MFNLELDKTVKNDYAIPGTAVIIGKDVDEVDQLGLLRKKGTDIILDPQPSSDPNDPLNWSMPRKLLHFFLLCFIAATVAAASAFNGPLYTEMALVYGVSYSELNTATAIQFLFVAIGCYFSQPLANKFGRRPVYLVSVMLSIIASLCFGLKLTQGANYAYSILNGLSVGPVDSLVEVSICDVFFLHEQGSYLAIYALALGIGTALAPLIAGYIDVGQDMSWCGKWTSITCGVLFVAMFLFSEESLYHRENISKTSEFIAVLGSNTGENVSESSSNDKHKEMVEVSRVTGSIPPAKSYFQRMKLISTDQATSSSWYELLIVPMYTARYPSVIWASITYGIQICWLSYYSTTSSEFYMSPPYNFSGSAVGLTSLGMLAGYVCGCSYSFFLSDWFQLKATRMNNGIFEPEFRLLLMPFPILVNMAGLFMYGLGVYYGLHWSVSVIVFSFWGKKMQRTKQDEMLMLK
ncbi:hypothetical protein PSN45_002371 [Yamadazyma tenuis]|uniref:uncharacterized protein n=1 Tax=Candida tenuis TaxID=2315449 RepID=UPI00279E188C|nr:hypothetical protein PSN45_002371 [Yamadazyma tenuis]